MVDKTRGSAARGAPEVRRFIRHPSEIPIEFKHRSGVLSNSMLHDVSEGGLSFTSHYPASIGEQITINIPFVDPNFLTECLVVWCKPHSSEGEYDIGVRFFHQDDVFKARMVEQVCHIEKYRLQMKQQGRELTSAEAALEWIEKFAESFTQPEDMSHFH